MKGLLKLLLLSSVLGIPVSAALAQSAASYPNRLVKIVLPLPPGGPTDLIARLAGAYFQTRFGQSFIVENRAGAGALIGFQEFAKAPNDGYTLIFNTQSHAIDEAVRKDWPFRIDRDLIMISILGGGGYGITVSNNIQVSNLRELVAFTKANPGKLNDANPGSLHGDMAVLRHLTGMGPVTSIVYPGAQQAAQAVATGESNFVGAIVQNVLEYHRSGKAKIIAYTGRQRHAQLPDVPTVSESGVGLNDYESGFWFALIGPGGVSPEIVTKLNAASNDLVKTPDFVGKMNGFGLTTFSLTPAQSRDMALTIVKQYKEAMAAGVPLQR